MRPSQQSSGLRTHHLGAGEDEAQGTNDAIEQRTWHKAFDTAPTRIDQSWVVGCGCSAVGGYESFPVRLLGGTMKCAALTHFDV